MEYYFNNDELYHYGRKGMKWGQNIFGRKRAAGSGGKGKGKSKFREEWEAKRQAKKEAKARKNLKKKSAADMTDEELIKAIRRSELEKRYNDLNPKKVGLGKKLVGGVGNVIGESLSKAGKTLLTDTLTKYGKQYLGFDADDLAGAKSGKESSSTQAPKKKRNQSEDTFFNATVSGMGTSKRASAGRTWTKETVIDADWYDVPTSSKSVGRSAQLGESFVSGLLPATKDD